MSTLDDAGEVRTTGLVLPDFLSEWLGGRADAPMATPLELTGDAMIPAFVVPIVDPDRASRLIAAYTKRGDSSRAERWDAFARGIGAHVPMSVVSEGETKQNKIYLPDLEATVLFDSHGRVNDSEQLHVTYYEERAAEVGARLRGALAAAKMELTGFRPNRGRPDPF